MANKSIFNYYGNDYTFYRKIVNSIPSQIRCAIPGVVQEYDSSRNTVSVQPAIREKIVDEKGEFRYINLPILINVPVVFPENSSYGIKFPLSKNDEVLVIFSDLSIDNFWLYGNVQNPIEQRRHDLSDGIAIPCCLSQVSKTNPVSDLTLTSNGKTLTFAEIYGVVHGE